MVLSIAGRIYAWGMRVREKAYLRGGISSWRPPVPCISVGNICWGGSGKTPLCSWLLQWSREKGLRPALLSRGYRALPPHLPYHVQAKSPVRDSGDEPLMLARENPDAVVVVDPCRRRGGQWAWENFAPDVFVLDDGLQHLAVQRDVDLVLLRPDDVGRDWNRVIPSGPWREGADALRRASAFIVNSGPHAADEVKLTLQSRLSDLQKPLFFCSYRVTGLRRVKDHQVLQPEGRYLLVSAVGSPDGVESSVRQVLSEPPLVHLRFSDHHAYTRADWENILHQARSLKADFVVCTSKDRVKLEPWADERLYVLDLDLEWTGSMGQETDFVRWLENQMHGLGPLE
ncbi:MAG: tetraacyldisaccharide 4'-kinase [Desulfovermiculus sp.]